jgi:hypothetical protein
LGRAAGGSKAWMNLYALAGVLVLAGAVASALLPKGHPWLALVGVAGAVVTAAILWASTGYEDFEGSPAIAALLLIFVLGGGWFLGVALGSLVRRDVAGGERGGTRVR